MIRGYLIGDKETVAKLGRANSSLRGKVKQSIVALTIALLVKVKEEKLTGQVLNVRTGRLRRSINQSVTDTGAQIYGVVGTNVSYGRAHEMGFRGQMSVKAHMRQIKKAWGKPLKSPKSILVRAHSRTVDFPERSFLRSSLREMEPKIRYDIREALQSEFKALR